MAGKVLSSEKILGGVLVKVIVNQTVDLTMIITSQDSKVSGITLRHTASANESIQDTSRFETSEYDGSKVNLPTTWRKLGSCIHQFSP